MTRIVIALCLLFGLGLPAHAATCECRISSPSVASDWLYLVGYNGNRIKWGSTSLTIPPGWQVRVSNAGLAPLTLYWVYVYDNNGAPALELSQTDHDPNAEWDETKVGDSSRLLVGMVYTDEDGKFHRDAQNQLILSWFNRLPIFAAPPAACITTAAQYPNWEELAPGSDNVVRLLTWGHQFGVSNNLVLGISGAATSNKNAGRVDLIFGFQELGTSIPVSSWISVTPAVAGQWQNVSGASTMGSPEGLRTVTFWGRSHAGAVANVCVNTFASTNG